MFKRAEILDFDFPPDKYIDVFSKFVIENKVEKIIELSSVGPEEKSFFQFKANKKQKKVSWK